MPPVVAQQQTDGTNTPMRTGGAVAEQHAAPRPTDAANAKQRAAECDVKMMSHSTQDTGLDSIRDDHM